MNLKHIFAQLYGSTRRLISILAKGTLVASVIILVLVMFRALSGDTQRTASYEKFIAQQEAEAKEIFSTMDSLPEEQRDVLMLQKAAHCMLSGTFCHDDLDLVTENDIAQSYSRKAVDLFFLSFMNMPASGIQSTAHAIAQAGIVPEAYAADGLGFGGIASFSEIWKQMRNVSFIVIVLAIIIAGFMIMFRTKIDANTAISIESTLPKLIVTLILIQFSFAIAGFLIDGMYVVSGLVIVILGPLVSPNVTNVELVDHYLFSSPLALIGAITGPAGFFSDLFKIFYTIPNALLSLLGWQIRFLFRIAIMIFGWYFLKPTAGEVAVATGKTALTFSQLLLKILGTKAGAIFSNPVSLALLGITSLGLATLWKFLPLIIFVFLPQIFIGAFLLLALIRAAWRIFKLIVLAYIKILLLVIFAPLVLLLDVIPTKSGFKPWIKGLMAELFVFPTLIAIIMVSFLIMTAEIHGVSLKLPFMFQIDPQAFSYIIGLALLAMTPDLIEKFKTATFGNPFDLISDARNALFGGPILNVLTFAGPGKTIKDRLGKKRKELFGKSEEEELFARIKKLAKSP